MAALSTSFLDKHEIDFFTYKINEGEVFPLVICFDGFNGQKQSGYIPIKVGYFENFGVSSSIQDKVAIFKHKLEEVHSSGDPILRIYEVFKEFNNEIVARVFLFEILGYEYLGNRTFRTQDIRELKDVIRNHFRLNGKVSEIFWSLIRNRSGFIAFDEVSRKNHQEAMLSLQTLNQVVVPLAKIEIFLIQEGLMLMSGGIIFSRILGPIFRHGYKLWRVFRMAKGLHRFGWLIRSFTVIQKVLALFMLGLNVKANWDTFKKIAEQIFILFDAVSYIQNYQQAAQKYEALILNGVDHLMDETEAIIGETIGFAEDQLNDFDKMAGD